MRKNHRLLLALACISALIALSLTILHLSQGQLLLGGLWALATCLSVASGVLNWKMARRD